MTRIPGYLRSVRFPARRIAAGAVHDLRRVGIVLLVGAVVAFMPLLWQIVDDELAPTAASPGVPAASGTSDDWIVVSRHAPVVRIHGQSVFFDACITYTAPRGTQQRCQGVRSGGQPATAAQREIARCWDQSRIGNRLPDCWR